MIVENLLARGQESTHLRFDLTFEEIESIELPTH